jgi:hypothetical protein
MLICCCGVSIAYFFLGPVGVLCFKHG